MHTFIRIIVQTLIVVAYGTIALAAWSFLVLAAEAQEPAANGPTITQSVEQYQRQVEAHGRACTWWQSYLGRFARARSLIGPNDAEDFIDRGMAGIYLKHCGGDLRAHAKFSSEKHGVEFNPSLWDRYYPKRR